jgi:cytochrome c2
MNSIAGRSWKERTRRRGRAAARILLAGSLAAGVALLSGCGQRQASESAKQIGSPSHGAALISYYGCGACHDVPGVPGANSLVGPPLTSFARRGYIAGMLRNTPDNLVAWIRNPQKIVPGNAMPALGIDEHDARDIAAYLYTLQ